MAALLYFEQRVHVKKLQRADTLPLYFPRLLSFLIERMGLVADPENERKEECRDIFGLRRWHFCTLGKEASESSARTTSGPGVQPSQSQEAPFQSPTSATPQDPMPSEPAPPSAPQTTPGVHSSAASTAMPQSSDTLRWLCSSVAAMQAHQTQLTQALLSLTSLLASQHAGVSVTIPPPPPMSAPPVPVFTTIPPMPTFEEVATPTPAAAAPSGDAPSSFEPSHVPTTDAATMEATTQDPLQDAPDAVATPTSP